MTTLHELHQLGLDSPQEAEALEAELHLSLGELTPEQRDVWISQNRFLQQYAVTRTVTTAANVAGVSIYTVRDWERKDMLGFNRRLETADLEFCDALEEMALARAREAQSSPALIIALLRAHLPNKYAPSKSPHPDDHDAKEALRRFRSGPTLSGMEYPAAFRAVYEADYQTNEPSNRHDPRSEPPTEIDSDGPPAPSRLLSRRPLPCSRQTARSLRRTLMRPTPDANPPTPRPHLPLPSRPHTCGRTMTTRRQPPPTHTQPMQPRRKPLTPTPTPITHQEAPTVNTASTPGRTPRPAEIPIYCDCCPHHPKKMAVLHDDAIVIIARRSGAKHHVRIPLKSLVPNRSTP